MRGFRELDFLRTDNMPTDLINDILEVAVKHNISAND